MTEQVGGGATGNAARGLLAGNNVVRQASAFTVLSVKVFGGSVFSAIDGRGVSSVPHTCPETPGPSLDHEGASWTLARTLAIHTPPTCAHRSGQLLVGWWRLERIWERFADFTLELLESRTVDGGLQLLEYRPTPLTAPPGTAWDR